MDSRMRNNVKLVAGMLGVGAAVALGAFGVTSLEQTTSLAVHLPPPVPTPATGDMKMGETITTTTPPPDEATTMAQPELKGPPALPSEEAGLP